MIKILQMLIWSFRLKRLAPFRINSEAVIRIDSSSEFNLDGRLVLGPNRSQQIVSGEKIVLSFGKSSKIKFGHSISFGPGVKMIVKNGGTLEVGNSTYFTSDMHIEVMNKVVIGNNCAISWGVTIIDNDHHQIVHQVATERGNEGSVLIGNHVWIGCNSTILKNTVLGDNCIVAANSLVKGNFPDNCLIGGNPAKILKEHITWK